MTGSMIVLGDHILYCCWSSSILSQEYLKTASWLKEVYGSGRICYLFVHIYTNLINLLTHTYVRRSWLTEIGEREQEIFTVSIVPLFLVPTKQFPYLNKSFLLLSYLLFGLWQLLFEEKLLIMFLLFLVSRI